MTTLGNRTYMLNDKVYREYPPAILSMYKEVLTPETTEKPKKVKANEEITDGSN